MNQDLICNIKDFGAKACDSLQTEPIQRALDACFLSGGGRVIIPKGIYRVGCIRLRSNTELHLESGAVLEGSHNPEDYNDYINDTIEPIEKIFEDKLRSVNPFSDWSNAIIRVIDAKNVSVTGEAGSFINGVDCYDEAGEEGYRGPHAIHIYGSENIYLKGYTVMHSANWAHHIYNTKNITAANLTVYGGHDGFDIRSCDNIIVENSEFYTGDDCIAGFDNNDVIIRDCIFNSSCSALRFGGNNVLIENCHSFAPGHFGHRYTLSKEQQRLSAPTDESCRHNMLTAFLYYCDFRAEIRKTPGDILVRNCTFENPDSAFKLEFDGEHVWCCNRSLSQICFENCKFTNVSEPVVLHGDVNEKINFSLKNVSISARDGFESVPVIKAVNYESVILDNVELSGFSSPEIISGSSGTVKCIESGEIKVK